MTCSGKRGLVQLGLEKLAFWAAASHRCGHRVAGIGPEAPSSRWPHIGGPVLHSLSVTSGTGDEFGDVEHPCRHTRSDDAQAEAGKRERGTG
jgi:hypothetical protein